jgi:hypothetical protein
MAKRNPYHTDSKEYPTSHREVYHDQTDCQYGKAIKEEHRKDGKGDRPRCSKCKELD